MLASQAVSNFGGYGIAACIAPKDSRERRVPHRLTVPKKIKTMSMPNETLS